MRYWVFGPAMALMMICGTSCAPSNATPAARPVKQPAADTMFTLVSGGKPALILTLPQGAQSKTVGGTTTIVLLKGMDLQTFNLWVVDKDRTPEEAVACVPDIIKPEFKDFKPGDTKATMVAGVPAKLLAGGGVEADDGDEGNAEVVLFALGGRVFAACVHGEGEAPAMRRDFMMAILQTAKVP
jgi:hypothetical protein